MSAPRGDHPKTDPSGQGPRPGHGSFFGRRKGHRLRAHQTGLIENLLPQLALDTGGPAPVEAGILFVPQAQDVRLEIGFGQGSG